MICSSINGFIGFQSIYVAQHTFLILLKEAKDERVHKIQHGQPPIKAEKQKAFPTNNCESFLCRNILAYRSNILTCKNENGGRLGKGLKFDLILPLFYSFRDNSALEMLHFMIGGLCSESTKRNSCRSLLPSFKGR